MRHRRWATAIVALLGIAITTALGLWQWHRAQQKIERQTTIQARQAQPALRAADWLAAPADPGAVHRRVRLTGRWATTRTVYLDNRQMDGRVGFYVVTPLLLDGQGPAVAVQRGWIPRDFQQRTRLQPVQTPEGVVTIEARIAPPPPKLYELGTAAPGPIRQNLDLAAWRAETGLPLIEAVSVQQLGGPSEGLLREWPVASSGADTNLGYAFQWWSLAALILILYAWFEFIAPRRRERRA